MESNTNHTAEELIKQFLFRHNSVLEDLPGNIREKISGAMLPHSYKNGDFLFKQGSYAKGTYLLKSGLVKIVHYTPMGQRQLIYIYAPGDWVGFRQLISKEKFPVDAIAIGDVEIGFLPEEAFDRIIKEEPPFTHGVLLALSREFSVWINRFTVFTRFPVKARLALCLLILHNRFSLGGSNGRVITFSRTDIADFIGTTLETTVRMLREFREAGWVSVKGKQMELLDVGAITELANKI